MSCYFLKLNVYAIDPPVLDELVHGDGPRLLAQ